MIEAVEVERFRGLRHLKVEGFGRVNLIIGRNDSGKTALMEALGVAVDTESAAEVLSFMQAQRQPKAPVNDFDQFWLPLFWNHEAVNGFTINAKIDDELSSTSARKGEAPGDITAKSVSGFLGGRGWSIEMHSVLGTREWNDRMVGTAEKVEFSRVLEAAESSWFWIKPNKEIGIYEIQSYSRLKQEGRESQLLDVLKQVDPRISGVELLAPSGSQAEIFVRMGPNKPLFSIAAMGDGFQRCFEFSVVAVGAIKRFLFIDEFENGLHHSVLEPVWARLAQISLMRDLQIFATTHSEECVQAACRAFTASGDDGLRVIRLDRREEETVATMYDRSLVEAATRMGVEIRG